jgi:hypothetical protein
VRSDAIHTIVSCSIAFAVAIGLTLICLALCGASTALFFGGFFILTPLLPQMLLSQSSGWNRLAIASCVVGGILIAWLIAVGGSELISFSQCARCGCVLIAYAMLLAGVTLILVRIRLNALLASAITTIAAMAWLTWPVWLVPNLSATHIDQIVAALVRFHPLFAVNGVLMNLGAWSHWTIAYRELTTLGQDIPYSLPQSTLPACAAHLIAGGVMMLIYCLGSGFSSNFPFKRSGAIIDRPNGSVIGPM